MTGVVNGLTKSGLIKFIIYKHKASNPKMEQGKCMSFDIELVHNVLQPNAPNDLSLRRSRPAVNCLNPQYIGSQDQDSPRCTQASGHRNFSIAKFSNPNAISEILFLCFECFVFPPTRDQMNFLSLTRKPSKFKTCSSTMETKQTTKSSKLLTRVSCFLMRI